MGRQQVCNFDDDPELYFNAGPARIPGHHRRILHYCKVLNVPLAVKANISRNAYTHEEDHFDGKPRRVGQYMTDARGLISELVYKAVDQNAFDQPLSEEDRERMLYFARTYGDLNSDGAYKGSMRAGYKSGGFGRPAEYYAGTEFGEAKAAPALETGAGSLEGAGPVRTPVTLATNHVAVTPPAAATRAYLEALGG